MRKAIAVVESLKEAITFSNPSAARLVVSLYRGPPKGEGSIRCTSLMLRQTCSVVPGYGECSRVFRVELVLSRVSLGNKSALYRGHHPRTPDHR